MIAFTKRGIKMTTCGIAGIGHLGKALTEQLIRKGINIRIFHPDKERRGQFAANYDNVEATEINELLKEPIVLLALPAEAIHSFLKDAQKELAKIKTRPIFVNLATLINTGELQEKFKDLEIFGVKMLGHADYLRDYGDGVFITNTSLEDKNFSNVRILFEKIGTLFEDDEGIVEELNGLAVRTIIEACMRFEKKTNQYPVEYQDKAMSTIFPNTMRLYRKKAFDGFMLKIMDDIANKQALSRK